MLETIFGSLIGVIIVFIIALVLLIKSSDIFTTYAEKLGLVIGIPPFIVGVTIVSIGTSLPELVSSLVSVFRGASEFVAGNVVGSNITNILLVVGVTAIIARKLKVEWDLIKVDLPLLLGSCFLITFMMWDGVFTFWEAILCLGGYLTYMLYFIAQHKKSSVKMKKEKFSWKIIIFLVLSGTGIYFGAEYMIKAIIEGTQLPFFMSLGINTSIIALTAVALGTSLPELMVSIQAARKKNFEVALGNVLGSNIFNSFVVMGISGLFGTLDTSAVVVLAVPFMVAATFLYIISTQDKEVSRFEGMIFVLFYILFIGTLFKLF